MFLRTYHTPPPGAQRWRQRSTLAFVAKSLVLFFFADCARGGRDWRSVGVVAGFVRLRGVRVVALPVLLFALDPQTPAGRKSTTNGSAGTFDTSSRDRSLVWTYSKHVIHELSYQLVPLGSLVFRQVHLLF